MSRGGRRPGGGRKPLPPEQRRVVLSCRVKPETFDAICREAGQGSIANAKRGAAKQLAKLGYTFTL